MKHPELDALAVELHTRLQHGGLRGLPVMLDGGQVMAAELMARIILADIEHIREWDRTHPTNPTSERRLRAVETHARQLLQLARNQRDPAQINRGNFSQA
jgi:hypothetical protein